MGSYCDRCYALFGSINEDNGLLKMDRWDLCLKCYHEMESNMAMDVKEHQKFNIIKGVDP